MSEPNFGPAPDPSIDPLITPPGRHKGRVEDRHLVASPEQVEEMEQQTRAQEETAVTTLTDEDRRNMGSIFTFGHRTRRFSIWDFTLDIRTLGGADDLLVGEFTSKYVQTPAFSRAYQIATVAAGTTAVDGEPLAHSLADKPNEKELFLKRCEAVAKWSPMVITRVQREIADLEAEFVPVLEKLGKLDG